MESEITEFNPEIRDRMESELLARTANTVKLPEGTQATFDRNFEGERLPNFPHQSANVTMHHDMLD